MVFFLFFKNKRIIYLKLDTKQKRNILSPEDFKKQTSEKKISGTKESEFKRVSPVGKRTVFFLIALC